MPETPNPSAEVLFNNAGKVDGRVSVALKEISRRLESNLPGLIAYANTQLGLSGSTAIRTPAFYKAGPVDVSDEPLNGILLAATQDTQFEGSGQFKNVYNLLVYSVDERVEVEEQYWRHWDRAGLVRAVLYDFMSGCIDTQSRVCWRSLVPQQSNWLPEEWEIFGGIAMNYTMTCDPSQNVWS